MSNLMSDSLTEKVLGGVLICRRFISGNSVGREGATSEGRQMTFNFRLDPALTQYLTVKIRRAYIEDVKRDFEQIPETSIGQFCDMVGNLLPLNRRMVLIYSGTGQSDMAKTVFHADLNVKIFSLLDPSGEYPLLVKRLRVFPSINWKFETIIDVHMDKIIDITTHPLYTSLRSSTGRARGRSVPTHRLNMDLASELELEAESMVEPARHLADGVVQNRTATSQEGSVRYKTIVPNAAAAKTHTQNQHE